MIMKKLTLALCLLAGGVIGGYAQDTTSVNKQQYPTQGAQSTDQDDREKINAVRKEYFGTSRPASTLVEVSRFTREGALVEIEATAVLPER